MKNIRKKIFYIFFGATAILSGWSLALAQYQNQEKIPGAEPTTDFAQYLKDIINFGFATIGILALFMLVIGAYQYLMAAGNLGKVESAKETIGSAIFGLLLGLCAWVILYKINPDFIEFDLSRISGLGTGSGTSLLSSKYGAVSISGTTKDRIAQYDTIIKEAAQKYPNVSESLIWALIDQESSGINGQTSPKGAQGLMQLMPGTARDLGVSDSFDPRQNILGGTKYASGMIAKYGLEGGLMAYNWGPGNYKKYKSGTIAAVPEETRRFVPSVIGKRQAYGWRMM